MRRYVSGQATMAIPAIVRNTFWRIFDTMGGVTLNALSVVLPALTFNPLRRIAVRSVSVV